MNSTQNKNLLEHKHKNQVFIRDKNIFKQKMFSFIYSCKHNLIKMDGEMESCILNS